MTPKNSLTPDLVELEIESLSYHGGRGVGRADGVVTFVPFTAPGDRVRARITARKKNLHEAELVEILRPSPHRRVAPCPVFGRCGGCVWQHVDYDEQVRQKERLVAHALKAFDVVPQAFVRAPDEFAYRNRVQLQVRGDRWGFFAARTRDLVEFEKCHIAEARLNEAKARHRPTEFAGASKVEFALDQAGEVRIMAGARDPNAALFAQVNTRQNEALKTLVRDAVGTEAAWFMDLYAGAGNFTGVLAHALPRAESVAIELSAASVARGREAHPSVEWIAADVGAALVKQRARPGFGVVLLDPPRTGCAREVVTHLARLAPARIVYVSCDPATFARDAARLLADRRYVFESVRGVDMFPQTEHVELIASFRRV